MTTSLSNHKQCQSYQQNLGNADLPQTEAYLEPCQTSKEELFAKVVNCFQPWTIFAKNSILDVWCLTGFWIRFRQLLQIWTLQVGQGPKVYLYIGHWISNILLNSLNLWKRYLVNTNTLGNILRLQFGIPEVTKK